MSTCATNNKNKSKMDKTERERERVKIERIEEQTRWECISSIRLNKISYKSNTSRWNFKHFCYTKRFTSEKSDNKKKT